MDASIVKALPTVPYVSNFVAMSSATSNPPHKLIYSHPLNPTEPSIIELLHNLFEASIDLFRYPINWATRLDCASLEWTPE